MGVEELSAMADDEDDSDDATDSRAELISEATEDVRAGLSSR
jgi:hypothetical protein